MSEIRFYRAVGRYGFLSNLFRRPIMMPDRFGRAAMPVGVAVDGTIEIMAADQRMFRSAEDAYQYGKPRRREVAEWLIAAPSPHLCALAAHALFVYDVREDWQTVKLDLMRQVLDAKFRQHDDLRALLITTGDDQLIEESKMDAFWGIGAKGTGRNMLGVLLMETREQLRGRPLA